ncbi:MAG: GIY-YIG nuclease family protein [Fidelibacterota bacterium]
MNGIAKISHIKNKLRSMDYKTMYYTYILKSIKFPNKTYIGYSENLKQRLQYHNQMNEMETLQMVENLRNG